MADLAFGVAGLAAAIQHHQAECLKASFAQIVGSFERAGGGESVQGHRFCPRVFGRTS
jgi:hypothetical protein